MCIIIDKCSAGPRRVFTSVTDKSSLLHLPKNIEKCIPVGGGHSNMVGFTHRNHLSYTTLVWYTKDFVLIDTDTGTTYAGENKWIQFKFLYGSWITLSCTAITGPLTLASQTLDTFNRSRAQTFSEQMHHLNNYDRNTTTHELDSAIRTLLFQCNVPRTRTCNRGNLPLPRL